MDSESSKVGTRFGLHAHACPCGHIWVHDGAETQLLGAADYTKEHTCSECGNEEYECSMPDVKSYDEAAVESRKRDLEALDKLLRALVQREE